MKPLFSPHETRIFSRSGRDRRRIDDGGLGSGERLDRRGVRVAFFKPIAQASEGDSGPERSTLFIRVTTTLKPADPIPLAIAIKVISEQGMDQLMGSVIAAYGESTASAGVVVVEGLLPMRGRFVFGSRQQRVGEDAECASDTGCFSGRQNDRPTRRSNRVCGQCLWRPGENPRSDH